MAGRGKEGDRREQRQGMAGVLGGSTGQTWPQTPEGTEDVLRVSSGAVAQCHLRREGSAQRALSSSPRLAGSSVSSYHDADGAGVTSSFPSFLQGT